VLSRFGSLVKLPSDLNFPGRSVMVSSAAVSTMPFQVVQLTEQLRPLLSSGPRSFRFAPVTSLFPMRHVMKA